MIPRFNLNGDLYAYTLALYSTKMLQGASILVTRVEFQLQDIIDNFISQKLHDFSVHQFIFLCMWLYTPIVYNKIL